MSPPNQTDSPRGDDDIEVTPALLARLDQDVSAALDFLCTHAHEWGGRRAAARIRRHRRSIVSAPARRAR